MRIAMITMAPPVAHRLTAMLRALGHDVPGVVMMPNRRRPELLADFILDPPERLDIAVASAPGRLAPLLRSFEPDVALCSGFGWRIPADALAVPPLGIVNGHPSVLPKYRGPNPFGWTFRNDDHELGFTFHVMDADFDTGPILAQGATPLTVDDSAQDIVELLPPLVEELLPRALARLESGDRGDPQPDEGASYAPAFEDEYVEIDWTQPAHFVHNQARAWFVPSESGILGPLTTLDGARVRVLRTRLVDESTTAASPGTILAREDGELVVQCGDGAIRIVQTEPVPEPGAS